MARFTKDTPTSLKNRTKEEQRRIATMGGIESGKVRAREKTLKEIFSALGKTEANQVIKSQLKQLGYDVDGLTMIDAIVKVASAKTFNKNAPLKDILNFVEVFAKFTGQEPAKKLELDGDITSKVKYIEPHEYKAVQDHINDVIGDTNDEPDD